MDYTKIAKSKENSRIRAEIWGDLINWENRRKGEEDFLLSQVKKHNCKRILDVALGDGADTIFLLQRGYEVSSNEVDDGFRRKAIENASKFEISISPTSIDWRKLRKAYQAATFDAILCTGNSMTCLFGRKNQIMALAQFYELLKPNGILIIDERNYQKLLDNKGAVLKGTLHSSGRYVYTGMEKVQVGCVEISDDAIILEYYHKPTGKKA